MEQVTDGMSMTVDSKSDRYLSRRRFVAAAVGTVGLTGCITGGGDNAGGDGNSENGGTTNIVFWHQEGVQHRVDTFQRFIDQFNNEHSNIRVSQEPQNWNSVFGKLTSALNAGNEPDFMFSLPAFTMTFQSRGDLVDVSSLVKKIDTAHDLYDNTVTPFEYDGGTWGVPMWDMVFLNHYRSDTLGQTNGWPPTGWNDWLDAVSTITNADTNKYGIVLPANKNLWTTEDLYSLMISGNSYVYGPKGKIMFDTKETVKTLDFYKKMFTRASPPGATNWGWAEWERSLLQETAHSTIGFSSWARRLSKTDLADNFSAMPQPSPSWGQTGSVHYTNNVMVFNEKKLDAIGTFIKWLHKQGNYGRWLATLEPTLYLPVTKTGEKSDKFWNHDLISQYKRMVQMQFKALPKAKLYGFRDIHVENNLYLPSLGTLEGSHVLAEVVQQLIVNDKSPENAARWGQSRLQEVLGIEKSRRL